MSEAPTRPRRSARALRATARALQREARKILRKHGARIAASAADELRAALAGVDTALARADLEALETEAERVDELLHRHAAFARKSAMREMIENLLFAVVIAVIVRLCLYEPFKIPSGSMMPTLYAGDHIFVNKFAYGIQIPFTNTVVGQGIGDIRRGDVVVFRYPLDESQDYIKRVIGLPGDEIRVDGREVAIKRPGAEDYVPLSRRKLDEPCRDESGERTVRSCDLYEETIDDHSYVVRYVSNLEIESGQVRVFRVPEGHLLMMGDNRNQSHDSLAWTATVEAVRADNLLSVKDLRDLTDEDTFSLKHPETTEGEMDSSFDELLYQAEHRSPELDQELSVWREPTLGAKAVFEAVAAQIADAEIADPAAVLAASPGVQPRVREQILEIGAGFDKLVLGTLEGAQVAAVLLDPARAVLQLRCGTKTCPDRVDLLGRLADVVARFHRDHDQHARVLLEGEGDVRYARDWSGRGEAADRFVDRAFALEGKADARSRVRIRAWRKPQEPVAVLRDAALLMLGTSRATATARADIGPDAWLVEHGEGRAFVSASESRRIVVVLECGARVCPDDRAALELARAIQGRFPLAALDWRQFQDLLRSKDIPGLQRVDTPVRELYEFDRVRLEGTVSGPGHTVALRVWRRPPDGLEARVAKLRLVIPELAPDDRISAGGFSGQDPRGFVFLFTVSDSEVAVELRCNKGVCANEAAALGLARRAAERARDPANFIDAEAERPRPYVPRGNVKGRADRIWLPISRFWLPVR